MNKEKISFTIGYPHEKLTLHLRMLTVSEEQALLQRFVDIADKDPAKEAKAYGVHVDALSSFSVDMPARTTIVDGKEQTVPLAEGKKSPADALKDYFEEHTVEKEWIADYAIRALRSRLQPEVRFL